MQNRGVDRSCTPAARGHQAIRRAADANCPGAMCSRQNDGAVMCMPGRGAEACCSCMPKAGDKSGWHGLPTPCAPLSGALHLRAGMASPLSTSGSAAMRWCTRGTVVKATHGEALAVLAAQQHKCCCSIASFLWYVHVPLLMHQRLRLTLEQLPRLLIGERLWDGVLAGVQALQCLPRVAGRWSECGVNHRLSWTAAVARALVRMHLLLHEAGSHSRAQHGSCRLGNVSPHLFDAAVLLDERQCPGGPCTDGDGCQQAWAGRHGSKQSQRGSKFRQVAHHACWRLYFSEPCQLSSHRCSTSACPCSAHRCR